jgi:hypothetical protein
MLEKMMNAIIDLGYYFAIGENYTSPDGSMGMPPYRKDE